MAAVRLVELPKVVTFALPFQFTTDEALKLVPVTVKVKPVAPEAPVVGDIEAKVGTGLLMVKVWLPVREASGF